VGSARQLISVTNLYLAPGEGIAQILNSSKCSRKLWESRLSNRSRPISNSYRKQLQAEPAEVKLIAQPDKRFLSSNICLIVRARRL
jgi:hypothetical protein